MADVVDRVEDAEETAAVTDAEVAEETVTVVEEAVEEFDDSSSKIKDKSADHEIDLTEANNLLEEQDAETKELMHYKIISLHNGRNVTIFLPVTSSFEAIFF